MLSLEKTKDLLSTNRRKIRSFDPSQRGEGLLTLQLTFIYLIACFNWNFMKELTDLRMWIIVLLIGMV